MRNPAEFALEKETESFLGVILQIGSDVRGE